ncbi:hypothetical protein OYT88_11865 [Sporolactobacillus sp. CQH2019]|nr:hypothetical protein [Sporolactobacillus sp. CQH2019]MDD9149250.1 hypothetical protein [Sporolactobacillus sp. CQH2019]
MKTIQSEVEDQLREVLEKIKGINIHDRVEMLKRVSEIYLSFHK